MLAERSMSPLVCDFRGDFFKVQLMKRADNEEKLVVAMTFALPVGRNEKLQSSYDKTQQKNSKPHLRNRENPNSQNMKTILPLLFLFIILPTCLKAQWSGHLNANIQRFNFEEVNSPSEVAITQVENGISIGANLAYHFDQNYVSTGVLVNYLGSPESVIIQESNYNMGIIQVPMLYGRQIHPKLSLELGLLHSLLIFQDIRPASHVLNPTTNYRLGIAFGASFHLNRYFDFEIFYNRNDIPTSTELTYWAYSTLGAGIRFHIFGFDH